MPTIAANIEASKILSQLAEQETREQAAAMLAKILRDEYRRGIKDAKFQTYPPI